MSEHWLKAWPEYYDDVESGKKPFEVRVDDRFPRYDPGAWNGAIVICEGCGAEIEIDGYDWS